MYTCIYTCECIHVYNVYLAVFIGVCLCVDVFQASPAAHFRFFSRVLLRHAPEERVWALEQLSAGEHVVVRWEGSEQHGIVASGRRVSSWSAERLQSMPLAKFLHGGELYRVVYPLWACRRESGISKLI